MWNPYMSEVEYYTAMNEFLEAYYGAGWRNIRFYIDWICSEAKESHAGIYYLPFNIISKDRWEAAGEYLEGLWEKAAELAVGDQVENVFRSRLQWRYIRLSLQPDPVVAKEFYSDILKFNIRWRENIQHPNDCYDFCDPPYDWYDLSDSTKPANIQVTKEKLARRAARQGKK